MIFVIESNVECGNFNIQLLYTQDKLYIVLLSVKICSSYSKILFTATIKVVTMHTKQRNLEYFS